MAFPASQDPQAVALAAAQNAARNLKQQATDTRNAMLAGSVSANLVVQIFEQGRAAKAVFTAVAAVSGIVAYAQAQYGNAGLNVATEFTAMMTQIDNVGSVILSLLPTGTGGFLLKDTLSAGSGITTRSFTTAQTAPLQVALANLIAAIS